MNRLSERLARRVEATRDAVWTPVLLDLGRAGDRESLGAILDRHPDAAVFDELPTQLAGLFETRDPAGTLDRAALAGLVRDALGDRPEEVGRWVWYPWSRRLVHVLGEAEYRELRTSRNRNKITLAEQERLRGLRIGIVGLSIGQAAAVTLTLEEVGGFLALADFDFLELSNMNRLRVGVHGLGVNKAVLAAREVFEINPYAAVEVWDRGVDEHTLDGFLTTGGRPLDLVFEECDDLHTKVLVRERARHHRIPVLMETSDRGLMDVERFDLEPERPIFHGLAGDVRAASLKGLSTFEKVPLVMRLIGREGMSDRMAASMVDIEASLKSWPQLASEVALGAGLNVDTARRVALGQLTASGRFYVDMHEHIDDARATPVTSPVDLPVGVSEEARHFRLPPLVAGRGEVTDDQVRSLVAWATTAFSGGNCQPWSFGWDGATLTLRHDRARSESFLDVDDRASFLAFGSVLENLALAGPAMGLEPSFEVFPDPTDRLRIADVRLRRAITTEVDPLLRAIPDRVTNRRLGERRPLDPRHRSAMSAEAASRGAELRWLEGADELDRLASILGRGDRIRLLSRPMHAEMMGEIRWSLEEVEGTRDGLDVATLEFTPTDLAGMRMIQSWPVMKMVGAVGGGIGLERPTRKAIGAASAAGLLVVPGLDPAAFLTAGRALQRVWLRAAADGVAFQPMTSLTYLFHRLVHAGAVGFTPGERRELTELRERFEELFRVPRGHAEPMLFRVGHAPPPTARSLRRHVDDVLVLRG